MGSERARRRLAGAALAASLVAVIGFGVARRGPVEPPTAPAAEAAGPTPAPASAAEPSLAAGAQAPAPMSLALARSPAEVQALQARDRRRQEALRPLEAQVAQQFELCTGARPGPRVPLPLMMLFEREAADSANYERFRVAAVVPVGGGAALGDLSARPESACLERFRGLQVDVPTGDLSQPDTFQHLAIAQIALSVGPGLTPTP